MGSSVAKVVFRRVQPPGERVSAPRSGSRRFAHDGSADRPRRPLFCWERRWRTAVSVSLASLTRWKGLCRRRHNPFYAEVLVMPRLLVLMLVRAVNVSVRSA